VSIDKSKISNHKLKLATIKLPISKSIANRLLLLQAIHGDSLLRVSADMPDDVIVLHDALQKIRDIFGTPGHRISPPSREGLEVGLKNCGTALRFLQVHLEKCYPGEPITLTGDPRLMERDGKPTSQTTSARILHGEQIPVEENESPYITMSRRIKEMYDNNSLPFREGVGVGFERCWSSASYWYEYVAIHGGQLLLEGLTSDSLQGDRIVADLYAQHFGVETKFVPEGAILQAKPVLQCNGPTAQRSYNEVVIDFVNIPDLYPAVALTCERLGIKLEATGTDRLRYKESDRLEAVRLHEVRNDHRIAMSLMAADYPVSIEEQACIAKSYPNFVPQHITPIRGVNDDNLGKKHALSKLIHAATSEYVWLHDDDIVLPKAVYVQRDKVQCTKADLIILPLRMEFSFPSGRAGVGSPSLLEKLQIAEYAAIQELTMRSAKRGHAVMCSGANLIVHRDVWLACESELHPDIPSGDDMFLLEAAKRHGYTVSVIDEPDYTAIVRPQTTWRAFFRQRMRWAGKAPHYTDPDIRRCGQMVVLANIAQLLFFPIILIKFPIEYNLIRKRLTPPFREGSGVGLFFVALLLEIFYPFYLLICLIGGLFRREW
jgi:5-enolpyruvylshikimate-3-phosphate synthase